MALTFLTDRNIKVESFLFGKAQRMNTRWRTGRIGCFPIGDSPLEKETSGYAERQRETAAGLVVFNLEKGFFKIKPWSFRTVLNTFSLTRMMRVGGQFTNPTMFSTI